jgi:hypothetical protein
MSSPRARRAPRRATLTVLVTCAFALLATACDSRDMPDLRSGWVNIPVGHISGSDSGMIGIDAFMWRYVACHDNRAPNPPGFEQDVFFGACAQPYNPQNGQPVFNSYTSTVRWSGGNSNHPSGLFLGNSGPCRDDTGFHCTPGTTIHHNWAKKWTSFALEFYPDDPQAGGVRMELACCPHAANGGHYSDFPGDVPLPRPGASNTVGLSGAVSNASRGQVSVDLFQIDDLPVVRTSTGVPVYGFDSTHNGADGQAASRWSVPAVFSGEYVAFITDNTNPSRKVVVRFHTSWMSTITINRTAPCFGLSGTWEPGTWYLNDPITPSECAARW